MEITAVAAQRKAKKAAAHADKTAIKKKKALARTVSMTRTIKQRMKLRTGLNTLAPMVTCNAISRVLL